MFEKIMLRAGIAPWPKLIQNLRASFETDLLNGKYGKFALTTIAKWLGHSVKVMLEHYGRIQQSDFDQIADACVQVKQKKDQMMGTVEAHVIPFQVQNDGSTLEYTESDTPRGVAQNAAQYTAAKGEMAQNEAEDHLAQIQRNSIQSKHLVARNGKGENLAELPYFTTTDEEGFEPTVAFPLRRFSRPVPSSTRAPIRSPFAHCVVFWAKRQ